jgi:hypothetical protein
MAAKEWIVQARLSGEFVIRDEQRESTAPLVEGLRRLALTPQFDDKGQWTGLHQLEATLLIENGGAAPLPADAVFARASRLVESAADMASLSIGRRVRVDGGVSAKQRIGDEPPRYRLITGATNAVTGGPPAELVAEVLAVDLDAKLQRIIRWWSRGVASRDPVDRLLSLSSALDLLAGTVDGVPGRVRKCAKCGDEQAIGPGLRERVVHLLMSELQFEEAEASEIYQSRIDVSHARSALREEDLRRFRVHAERIAEAVRDGVSRRLGLQLPPIPTSLPVDPHSALLDVEFTEASSSGQMPPGP